MRQRLILLGAIFLMATVPVFSTGEAASAHLLIAQDGQMATGSAWRNLKGRIIHRASGATVDKAQLPGLSWGTVPNGEDYVIYRYPAATGDRTASVYIKNVSNYYATDSRTHQFYMAEVEEESKTKRDTNLAHEGTFNLRLESGVVTVYAGQIYYGAPDNRWTQNVMVFRVGDHLFKIKSRGPANLSNDTWEGARNFIRATNFD